MAYHVLGLGPNASAVRALDWARGRGNHHQDMLMTTRLYSIKCRYAIQSARPSRIWFINANRRVLGYADSVLAISNSPKKPSGGLCRRMQAMAGAMVIARQPRWQPAAPRD